MLFLSLKGSDHWMAQGFVICRTGLLSLPCAAGLLSPRWGVNPDTQTESISADKYSPNESAVLAPGCQVARCGCSAFAPVAGAAGLFPPYYPPWQGTDGEKGQWTRDPTLLPSWMRQQKSLSGLRGLHEAQLSREIQKMQDPIPKTSACLVFTACACLCTPATWTGTGPCHHCSQPAPTGQRTPGCLQCGQRATDFLCRWLRVRPMAQLPREVSLGRLLVP